MKSLRPKQVTDAVDFCSFALVYDTAWKQQSCPRPPNRRRYPCCLSRDDELQLHPCNLQNIAATQLEAARTGWRAVDARSLLPLQRLEVKTRSRLADQRHLKPCSADRCLFHGDR